MPFCAARLDVVQRTPPVHTASTGLVWGRPLGCKVVNQYQRAASTRASASPQGKGATS